MTEKSQTPALIVRATINLPGLKRGKTTEADRDSEYVRSCLSAGYLVPVGESELASGGR